MKIQEIYSHLNGLEFLLVRKPDLWQELRSIILEVDIQKYQSLISLENANNLKLLFNPVVINSIFRLLLREQSWEENQMGYKIPQREDFIEDALPTRIREKKQVTEVTDGIPVCLDNRTDFVKDRVTVEIQFGKYTLDVYDLFAKPLAFYVGDYIDVGVEVLAMKSLQSQMSSGVAYYEGELYNVVRQSRGVPAVPLVLVGVDA